MHASFAPNQMVRTRTLGKFVSLLFAMHYWSKISVPFNYVKGVIAFSSTGILHSVL